MTLGHKHRHWDVPSFDVWYARLLRKPVLHATDTPRVDRSPYPYGPCKRHKGCWTLSPLGILHRWTGLTLRMKEER